MSKRWLAERKNDYYYKKAKKMDYRSRAAFKLKQIDDRFHILRKGARIVDLGAAPGGWLQVAREVVGPSGKVVGLDMQSIEPIDDVIVIRGDIREEETVNELFSQIGGKVDVVLSDMSPHISGSYSMDHARSVELCHHGLVFASKVLKKRGCMVMKIFQGDMMQDFLAEVRNHFGEVRLHGPKASRSSSSEIYIIAKGFLG
ncbi:MAG: RlmE family RNA methyltransferase [Methanomassiliicoccales archaeon]|nr:RlmE family RNA methyltransferase [Methanomassiliicoccales archaeon]